MRIEQMKELNLRLCSFNVESLGKFLHDEIVTKAINMNRVFSLLCLRNIPIATVVDKRLYRMRKNAKHRNIYEQSPIFKNSATTGCQKVGRLPAYNLIRAVIYLVQQVNSSAVVRRRG